MIDNMLFMAAYGHKTMFESSRTRPAFRAAFAAYSLKVAIDKVDDFFESRIEHRSRNPADKLAAHLAESAVGVIDLDALMVETVTTMRHCSHPKGRLRLRLRLDRPLRLRLRRRLRRAIRIEQRQFADVWRPRSGGASE